eukprot:TRINITY_DN371_c1_g1_i1.p2 TRINITY_DN371_c1_g1~~TRINITY_DN371_c1_g1_i1.p2  ORF type:complete len:195 (+),score=97.23 TRINITY_DN371_c1_g1_i1:124-708(+)
MSLTGTVKSWNGKYGFVETKEGTLAYVHTSEIDGGKLRIGRTVKLDTEAVEGHDGRVKGVNVAGEGVLAKGEKLGEDDLEADKKLRSEVREEFKKTKDEEYEPVRAQVDTLSKANQVRLVRELSKELKLDAPAPKAAKQAKADNERRQDPTQRGGPGFTKLEFVAFYGQKDGLRMWEVAGALSRKGGKGSKKRA